VILSPVLFYHYVLAFLDQPRRNYLLIGGYAITVGLSRRTIGFGGPAS